MTKLLHRRSVLRLGLGMLASLIVNIAPALGDEVFDPEALAKSTVKILVKNGPRVVSAASGFVWRADDQIVTSLHVISPGADARIIVEFDRKKRLASVKSVLPGADLVLLEVTRPIDTWVPLAAFSTRKPAYREEVAALGFNRGSAGMSTRELRKGFVKPETLQMLLPPDALERLTASEVLDTNLPIYYMDGSLLPGYSGSPVVDMTGALIGVGDGGLENGAASVSWVIPAHHLDALTASTQSELPPTIASTYSVFTGDNDPLPLGTASLWRLKSSPLVQLAALGGIVPFVPRGVWLEGRPEPLIAASDVPGTDEELDEALVEDEEWQRAYREVRYREFSFVKTKTRTFAQMLGTTSEAAELLRVFMLYRHLFEGYRVGYEDFSYDIYEDSRHGLVLSVPSGTELKVARNKHLLVEGDLFCRRCPYEIQYYVRTLEDAIRTSDHDRASEFLNAMADEHWDELSDEGDYGEYEGLRSIEAFGDGRYVIRAGFSDLHVPFQNRYEVNYYTAATNGESWFQVEGILNRFDKRFREAIGTHRETDCRAKDLSTEKTDLCRDISTMLKIMIGVHLTSFSNKHMRS